MGRVKAGGKWMDGVDAQTPVNDAAHAYLKARLSSVVTLLPLAHEKHEQNLEYVHQLRVATRRSDAALIAFRMCLKRKGFEKMRKCLRRIRRAAGLARTCDVHELVFASDEESYDPRFKDVFQAMRQRNADERTAAQAAINKVADRYDPKKLPAAVENLLVGLHQPKWAKHATLLDAAREELPELIADVRQAASLNMRALRNMHELRIEGKRLRYAMEIFSPCYEPSLRSTLYPIVEQMQDPLGEINDSHELVNRIRHWARSPRSNGATETPAPTLRRGMIETALCYRQQCRERSEHFLDWWSSFGVSSFLDDLEQRVVGEAET